MASRSLPGLGLTGFWDLGASDWKPGMDANMRTLSVLVQTAVLSRTDALPATPDEGEIYIVPTGPQADNVAIFDNGEWVYITPHEGHFAWVIDQEELVMFDGTDWVVFSAGVKNLSELLDVDVTTASPTDGQVLKWDAVADKWKPGNAAATLAGLTDYDGTPPPAEGQVLTYNDTTDKWEPRNPSAGNLATLGDVDVTTDAPTNGDLLQFNGTSNKWVPFTPSIELSVFASGVLDTSEVIFSHVATKAFTLPSGLTGSRVVASVASTGTAVLKIKKNGADVGTITFTASATGVLAMATATAFAPGDILTIVAPSSPDATLANISASLVGSLT
ncbi:putative tail fiber protein [Mesorhizobium phage Cp1R7A-A1]|nr:putative tail fiber protein [Mesorhizobium phage Cp1R7A-A1]